MVCFPDVQERAQRELDEVLEGSRLPNFSDVPLMPYISALVKEVLRCEVPVLSQVINLTPPTGGKSLFPVVSWPCWLVSWTLLRVTRCCTQIHVARFLQGVLYPWWQHSNIQFLVSYSYLLVLFY